MYRIYIVDKNKKKSSILSVLLMTIYP